MTWPADASDWMDVVDHMIVIIGALMLAAVPTWAARKNHQAIKEASATADSIKNQIVNGHPPDSPKLRDDIDAVKSAMERWEPMLHLVPDLLQSVSHLSRQLSEMGGRIVEMGDRVSNVGDRVLAEEDKRRAQISALHDELDKRTGKRHIS